MGMYNALVAFLAHAPPLLDKRYCLGELVRYDCFEKVNRRISLHIFPKNLLFKAATTSWYSLMPSRRIKAK
jgi:hypothetical protein